MRESQSPGAERLDADQLCPSEAVSSEDGELAVVCTHVDNCSEAVPESDRVVLDSGCHAEAKRAAHGALQVTFVSVGQGDCVVVEFPDAAVMVGDHHNDVLASTGAARV